MKISASDDKHIAWDAVAASFKELAEIEIADAVSHAKDEFAKLRRGERKTVKIELGSITVSKPKE